MRHRGAVFAEVLAALVVLTGVVSLALEGLSASARQQRELERRAAALEIAASALEELTALPFADITAASAEKLGVIQRAIGQLPGGKLEVEVQPVAEPVAGKRIALAVLWDTGGRAQQAARLTTWVYQHAGSQP